MANAQSALAQARASGQRQVRHQAEDKSTQLRDTEAELTVEHGRLANEIDLTIFIRTG